MSNQQVNKRPLAPQVAAVLRHLQVAGSISNVEAQAVHRIRALPRRIRDLVEAGIPIRKERRQDATGQRYVRYYLDTSANGARV